MIQVLFIFKMFKENKQSRFASISMNFKVNYSTPRSQLHLKNGRQIIKICYLCVQAVSLGVNSQSTSQFSAKIAKSAKLTLQSSFRSPAIT